MSQRSNSKSHRDIPDLMSTSIPRGNFSTGRNNYNALSYRSGKPRSIPVPLMTQDTGYARNSRFAPYTGSGRFQHGFECRVPIQQPKNRNQTEYGSRENRLRSDMYRLSYSEALKATSSNTEIADEASESVTLQISNLDPTIEEHNIRHYLLSQLKPITPVMSLIMETPSTAKVKVPSNEFAKQVVTHLHRKKVGHKRILVSYLKDPSSAETSALKCQITGLLKDVPNNTLQVYKFRELFQSRFKTSISILDLYRMQDVCIISHDKNDERFISLHPDLVHAVPNNPLIDSSQHSVPYCVYHFKQEKDKGWAELEIEPLPNIMLSISQIESLMYSLLKVHKDDIPVASLMHCIEAELKIKLDANENGVPLECLITCARGVQITNNSFGIKIVSWMEQETLACDASETSSVNGPITGRFTGKITADPLCQISREVIELVKMSPKAIMKFNRFIPAYHNHFGKQCRVADYGYTRLIDLFEALSNTVQIIGDGENRCIALTHRTQIRRFTSDLLKILRSQPTKSIYLSHLPEIFSISQNHAFDITDYGVCDVKDMLDGLVNNNSIVIEPINNGTDVLISITKRQQTPIELEKTSIFAGEVVELFRNAAQYSIPFKKFVRSYHYHFGYQCRLSDYGFTKLAELLEAISGVVKMENGSNDEDRKIFLCQDVALRVFSEQLQDLIKHFTGKCTTLVKLHDILQMHKNKFGYQMNAQTLGYENIAEACQHVPFVEVFEKDGEDYIICHLDDTHFRQRAYAAAIILNETGSDKMTMKSFVQAYAQRFNEILTEKGVFDMRHAVKITFINGVKMVCTTSLMKLLIRIGLLLERETYLNICEIKAALDLSLSNCFEMGYPNLSALIQAHLDIFSSPSGNNIHERSDIRLHPDSILTQKGLHKFIEQCKQYLGNTSKRSFGIEHLQPKALPYAGNQHRQTPGAKPRNIACAEQAFVSAPSRSTTPRSTFFPDNQRYALAGGFKPNNCLKYTMPYDRQNMENFQLDMNNNNPIGRDWNTPPVRPPPGYLPKQNSGSTHQAMLPPHERRHNLDNTMSNFSDMFGLNSLKNGFESIQSYYYEPPKPDTPPTRNIAFTYDPIWSNNVNGIFEGDQSLNTGNNMHSLNIHLPELKTLNIMPVMSSPCGHTNTPTPSATNVVDKNNNIK
ncbi:meiosis regulator and mRNA stability factor 1 [Culicoides brevitarsis]|uniref:meiosis regulator and mRNA stability factor 1 n=1 Tax=Culicoides brevitarsis TaxID=469753 RepID=UPI00307B2077